jgi:hypothetical protein
MGPVKLVNEPPVLSAEIAVPPVAGVTVCAYASLALRRRTNSPKMVASDLKGSVSTTCHYVDIEI